MQCLFPLRRTAALRSRLVCFPFAGGSTYTYQSWIRWLPPDVDVVGVELPGRGPRIAVSPVTRYPELLNQLLPELSAILDGVPTVFFGHSMGALLAYGTAVRLVDQQQLPQSLVLSSCAPPHLRATACSSSMDDDSLIQWLRRMEGTPGEILTSSEALSMVLPVLRADLQLMESYPDGSGSVLPCPILAIGGTEDPSVSMANLQAWEQYTSASFQMENVPGGHFYFRGRESRLGEILGQVV